jgi:hypothetical protein
MDREPPIPHDINKITNAKESPDISAYFIYNLLTSENIGLSVSTHHIGLIIRRDVWPFRLFCQLEDNLGQPALLKRKPR